MEQLTRISSPASESWVAWVMLLVLTLLLLVYKSQRGMVLGAIRSMFDVKERDSMFTETSSAVFARLVLHLYRLIVIAFTVYLLTFVGGNFSFVVLLKLMLCVAVVGVVKYLSARLLAYVYFDNRTLQLCLRQYGEMLTVVTVFALLPLMLSVTWFSLRPEVVLVWAALLYILFIVSIAIKLFRLFFNKIFACFYILLYLCTLELLPIGILLNVSWYIAS